MEFLFDQTVSLQLTWFTKKKIIHGPFEKAAEGCRKRLNCARYFFIVDTRFRFLFIFTYFRLTVQLILSYCNYSP